jgi:hypothetical protein
MFKNLSDKYKLYIILAGLVAALLICYKVAFKSTFKAAANYRQLKERVREAADMPEQTALLQRQLTELNTKYFNEKKGFDDSHELILDKLSRLASKNSVLVTEYPEIHIYKSSTVQVETHTAVLKGGFLNLLHVLYEIEVHERIGRIVSVDYFTETDRKTKARSLFVRILIQNYRNLNPHEEK